MVITCPHCHASKDIGDVRIPKGGVIATCKSCQRQFELRPEQEPTAETTRMDKCPACGLTFGRGMQTDSCGRCGLVFSKYLARARQVDVPQEASDNLEFAPADEKSALQRIVGSKRFWGIALLILIAVWARFGHDWKLDQNYLLQPGNWQGEMSFRGKQHPFLLVIQTVDGGKLEGYMDWTETMPRYRLAIRGTHTGNHLLFEDYKFLEGEGKYGLHDNQDVYIVDNEMNGTAKNGQATLHAIQVATSPDSARELQKY
jgi:transcription elongation factor Elf1